MTALSGKHGDLPTMVCIMGNEVADESRDAGQFGRRHFLWAQNPSQRLLARNCDRRHYRYAPLGTRLWYSTPRAGANCRRDLHH